MWEKNTIKDTVKGSQTLIWKEVSSGTKGYGLRIEGLQVKLFNYPGGVKYRVYVQKFGWLGWTGNGQTAGTSGYGYRIETVQMMLVVGGGTEFNSSYGKNPAYRT